MCEKEERVRKGEGDLLLRHLRYERKCVGGINKERKKVFFTLIEKFMVN